MHEFVYFLKREYGHPMQLTHITAAEVNVDTGGVGAEETTYEVQVGVLLAVDILRTIFTPGRSTNYPYGNLFDEAHTLILLEKRDLPDDFNLNNNDLVYVTDLDITYKIIDVKDLHHWEIDAVHLIVEELQQSERGVQRQHMRLEREEEE